MSDKTATKAFKQLNNVGLVQEKRQGLGKPNLIYVGKIQHEETENLRFLIRKNYDSVNENITNLESENLREINTNNIKTNIINTDSINPNSDDEFYLKEIKDKCKLEDFSQEEKTSLEDVINSLYYKDTLKVGSVTVNHYKILDKLKLIVKENLALNKELSKQVNIVDFAENFKEDYINMTEKNVNLRLSNSLLKEEMEKKEKKLELKFESKAYNIEYQYKKEINRLKQENKHLNKMIDKFKTTLKKFIKWLCHKFSYPSEDELVRDFEKETYTKI